MSAAPKPDAEDREWRAIVRLTRAYARRKYGRDVEAMTLHLTPRRPGEPDHREPFPPAWADDGAET